MMCTSANVCACVRPRVFVRACGCLGHVRRIRDLRPITSNGTDYAFELKQRNLRNYI